MIPLDALVLIILNKGCMHKQKLVSAHFSLLLQTYQCSTLGADGCILFSFCGDVSCASVTTPSSSHRSGFPICIGDVSHFCVIFNTLITDRNRHVQYTCNGEKLFSCSGTGIEKGRIFIIIFMNMYYITGYEATSIVSFNSIEFLGYKNMGIDTKIITLSLVQADIQSYL